MQIQKSEGVQRRIDADAIGYMRYIARSIEHFKSLPPGTLGSYDDTLYGGLIIKGSGDTINVYLPEEYM